ncbi:centromere protein I isoform X2 [Phyllobates terribilis]|uniref:centromere protein I isoform X2 n=1 Tax=Phyllobates terribilis TaxID=111132 RepID=UPI003CCAC92E
MEEALHYFKQITSRVPLRGNSLLIRHLTTIETVGLTRGVPAEGVDILLRQALSANLVDSVNQRILKCLIPATELHQDSVTVAVSLFCTRRSTPSTQCPIICHLLYLITKKEHVQSYRVRCLLELQNRKGLQPYILGLLSIYKVFRPELVSLTLPSRIKMYFKNSKLLFTSELSAIKRIHAGDPVRDYRLSHGESKKPPSRPGKRKWNSSTYVPVSSRTVWSSDVDNTLALGNTSCPVEKIQTFSQLLENILQLQLPAQMGCVIQSPLLLNFITCVNEDDSLLRLNYWLAFTLHEECAWYTGQKRNDKEVEAFLNTVIQTQEFLQEGLSGTEAFLHKCLPRWDGIYATQILQLISWIPLYSFSDIEDLLFKTLRKLFKSSSMSFKIDVLKTLKRLLQNWLVKYSAGPDHESAERNATLSSLMTCGDALIQFTGGLCTSGILSQDSPLLLNTILDFYKLVSEMFIQFNFPLVVLPPSAVFYTALLCTDSVNLNQLCFIMHRYRDNILMAKRNEQVKTSDMLVNISSQTCEVYNQYLTTMVGCLWTSQAFNQDTHPQGIKMTPELFVQANVPMYKTAFNIIYHPALLSFSIALLRDKLSEELMFDLHLLKGKYWDTYIDFVSNYGMADFILFIERSVKRVHSKKETERSLQP